MIFDPWFRSLKVFSASLIVLVASASAFAQGGAATGDLHITVKDPKGSFVANATVMASDAAKGVVRTATGDNQGGYSVASYPRELIQSAPRPRVSTKL